MHNNNTKKIFYTISEVAKMLKVNESKLRFWEKEFPEIKPMRGGRGIRHYKAKDVEIIKQIYFLTEKKGYTLNGARESLRNKKDVVETQVEVIERLTKIKEELISMRDALDKFTYKQVEELKV